MIFLQLETQVVSLLVYNSITNKDNCCGINMDDKKYKEQTLSHCFTGAEVQTADALSITLPFLRSPEATKHLHLLDTYLQGVLYANIQSVL